MENISSEASGFYPESDKQASFWLSSKATSLSLTGRRLNELRYNLAEINAKQNLAAKADTLNGKAGS